MNLIAASHRVVFARSLSLAFCMLILSATPTMARQSTGTPAPFPSDDAMPEGTPYTSEPITVVTSLNLVADWARQVGGDRVIVTAILPANADPHDYDPKPEDVGALDSADLILTFGLGIDLWAADIISASGSDAPMAIVTDGIDLIRPTDPNAEFDFDPHVWFDPIRTASIVANIETALSSVDPSGESTYQQRADAYKTQLDLLDVAIQQRIDTVPAARRKLVTNHDAFGYFAQRYGLTVVGTVIPSLDSRAEASAADIADLIDLIEQENIPAIFSENSVPPDLARTVAEQTGATFVSGLYTGSLGEEGSGADTYLGMMQTDTEIIVAALSE